MWAKNLHQKIRSLTIYLESFSQKKWYLPLIFLLSLLDNLVLIIPNDGILISSVMLTSRRWFKLGLSTGLGSAIGAFTLFLLVERLGLPFINNYFPSLTTSYYWEVTEKFYFKYGLYFVFIISLTPFTQQPAVILAAFSHVSADNFFVAVALGRVIKYIAMAYIASHMPQLITKMKWFKDELHDSGVDLK